MPLPIKPPFPPMDALSVDAIPRGPEWEYEPKWDGFRCLVFKDGAEIELQSKSGQPLGRYFPEIVEGARDLKPKKFVIDGELVVPIGKDYSFDNLLMRVHPAASRVKKLATETPAQFVAFDLLVNVSGKPHANLSFAVRRAELEKFVASWFAQSHRFRISPATRDFAQAEQWLAGVVAGLDGVIAKRLDAPYESGERSGAVQKIKLIRAADCVVGGFRYAEKGKVVGSLLLGLYDESGLLHHVGFCSGIKVADREPLTRKLERLIQPPGFTGRAPGGPSRWSTARSAEWQPLKPALVAEVAFDHVTGERFRHGTRFLRWRPDKAPAQCGLDQLGAKRSNKIPG